ncbi:MAG TPA: ABC-type transport auxiliary lipoprotein family protein [Sphingomonadaceae bacterium]|nr:ABC-type transport auxiliary lipoprotein family protein [Sphingomonadaceae bacterium]
MSPRALLTLLAALPLAGCVSLGSKPPTNLLTLTPQISPEAGAAQTVRPGEAVTVLTPRARQALNVQRVPVISAGGRLAYFKDTLWADTPNRLFRDLLADVIAGRTGRPVLDVRQYSLSPGIRLTGTLEHFELDRGRLEGVVVYVATLARGGDAPIETRRFEARVPAASDSPINTAAALNTAANQVAVEVADWIGAARK